VTVTSVAVLVPLLALALAEALGPAPFPPDT
jgi:hypothetical protein